MLLLVQLSGATVAPDSVETLLEHVRDAQADYERLARRRAPRLFDSGGSGRCDERVGRFCLRHDPDESRSRRPEPPVIARARAELVETLRAVFSTLPGEPGVVGPLIQYLVQDERAAEAVAAARTFAVASDDSVEAALLHGFALHAAGRDTAAERLFSTALRRLPSEERRAMEEVGLLLASEERDHYEDLDDAARLAYETALWTMADPLYLTPGNERRMEHLARRVWTRLLARTPVTLGMHRWGRDLEELAVRYGVPESRARIIGTRLQERRIVEWYDSTQLTFVPPELGTEGMPTTPGPRETEWWVENPRAQSQYAPSTVRRLVALEHRVARFPAGDSVRLRVDGAFELDTAAAGAEAVETGLFVLDESEAMVRERRSRAPVQGDTVEFAFQVTLPPGRYVYSLEALDTASRLAGRARYAVTLPRYPRAAIALSDLVGLSAFRDARRPQRVAEPEELPGMLWSALPRDTVGLYAEAHHLATAGGRTGYGVEVVVRRVDEGPAVEQAVRWLGRRLGLVGPPERARVAWSGTGDETAPALLAVDFALDDLDPGLYVLELTVTDRVAGLERTRERFFRVRAPDEGS